MRVYHQGNLICSECGEEYPNEYALNDICQNCYVPHISTARIDAFYYAEDKHSALDQLANLLDKSVPFLTFDDLAEADPFFCEQFAKIKYDW